MNEIISLSAQQLRQAAEIKDKIESLQNELDQISGLSVAAAVPRKRRKMSAAGRARIAAAQKARWAKFKAPAQKPKRQMSVAAGAKIAAAAKARWAKIKMAKSRSA
ncbi:MAG: hypothetical protein ACREDS_13390 [Limisphaerales bacterium]